MILENANLSEDEIKVTEGADSFTQTESDTDGTDGDADGTDGDADGTDGDACLLYTSPSPRD